MCLQKFAHVCLWGFVCEGETEVSKQTTEEPHHRMPPQQQELRILSFFWE